MRYPLFAGLVILMACTGRNTQIAEKSKVDTVSVSIAAKDTMKTIAGPVDLQSAPDTVADAIVFRFKAFVGKVVYGDFDGNGIVDTVSEHLINMKTFVSIDSFPDPYVVGYDSLVSYGGRNSFGVALKTSGATANTAYLGRNCGTYVILNVGDITQDGADDLALVLDYLDYTVLNSCRLYSLCGRKWKQVGEFDVSDSAFDYVDGKLPVFKSIPEFLERRKGKWMYRDYMESMNADTEADSKRMKSLKSLKLLPCSPVARAERSASVQSSRFL